MSFLRIWAHYVWGTKNRLLYLKGIKNDVCDHIRKNAALKGIHLDSVNGFHDHIHCLLTIDAQQTPDNIAMLLKGESSHWINKMKLTQKPFQWCHEFFGVSVSESALPRVRAYIRNQDKHHQRQSFEEEYEILLKFYGFSKQVGG